MMPDSAPYQYGQRTRLRASPAVVRIVDGIGWGRMPGAAAGGPVVTLAGMPHAVPVTWLLPADECAALDAWDALELATRPDA